VLKLAPVDSLAKPIRTEKKKKRLKKSSVFTLTIYSLFVIIFIMMYTYTMSDLFIGYSISILGGVVWQILSLTKLGHLLVKLIDTFFNK
ncbi:MAG: accessory gene regulator B family protein, partial [Clostridium sp.]